MSGPTTSGSEGASRGAVHSSLAVRATSDPVVKRFKCDVKMIGGVSACRLING